MPKTSKLNHLILKFCMKPRSFTDIRKHFKKNDKIIAARRKQLLDYGLLERNNINRTYTTTVLGKTVVDNKTLENIPDRELTRTTRNLSFTVEPINFNIYGLSIPTSEADCAILTDAKDGSKLLNTLLENEQFKDGISRILRQIIDTNAQIQGLFSRFDERIKFLMKNPKFLPLFDEMTRLTRGTNLNFVLSIAFNGREWMKQVNWDELEKFISKQVQETFKAFERRLLIEDKQTRLSSWFHNPAPYNWIYHTRDEQFDKLKMERLYISKEELMNYLVEQFCKWNPDVSKDEVLSYLHKLIDGGELTIRQKTLYFAEYSQK